MKKYAWINVDGKHCQEMRHGPPPPISAKEWICFEPNEHVYTDELGRVYESATTFIKRLDDSPFNPQKMSVECAAKAEGEYSNMTPEEIMQQWLQTGDVGTEAHEAIEACVNGVWHNDDREPLQPIVDQFACWMAHERAGYKTKPELIVWDRDLLICGTADLVHYRKGHFLIDDNKTWKKLTSDRKHHAELQVTLCAMMLEKLLGITARVGGVIMFENYFDMRGGSTLQFVPLRDVRDQLMPAIWTRGYERRCIREAEMALTISGGVKDAPKRVVIHGTEGVGKSTFASRFPSPVFIDTEGSTDEMNVQRLPSPKDWNAAKQLAADIRDEPKVAFKTLVIDTVDWLESVAAVAVAKSKNKKLLADIGFGKGELALAEEMKAFLDTLDQIQEKHGVHIVLTAHTAVKRFDPPDMPEGFDRYELKLKKHTAPIIREWCNMLLFANFASEARQNDGGKAKGVADGTTRWMYTTRTDAYDAKNRCGLDNPLPFKYASIQHVIEGEKKTTVTQEAK